MNSLLSRMFSRPSAPTIDPMHNDAEASGIEYLQSEVGPLIYQIEPAYEERKRDMNSVSRIGVGMCFRGEIHQAGTMEIQGELIGKAVLTGQDAVLCIGEDASFQGEGSASNVDIRGRCNATIVAASVVIHESATTRGAIVYDRIAMHGGDNDISLRRNPVRQP